ncbi:MAG: chromosome segregation SMC family protein, partial [Rhodospirillales bacterium]|nr:chromosome segregation SMC family protein [Rhodospirillales bacterium]
MHFNRLRLAGFKSFVDPTEMAIEPGMTGIVGPNGCGKSNLVDALKWVMGETSAKQMRGGEMDDVIFNGTSERPPRNLAEVVLSLDNSDRTASAAFNDTPEIDVSRRIRREKGSSYRINAKEVRARDVQLLFADAVSGARSTAMVSQGHIGAVVSAKPAARRKILEEAAGITGLHSRRHEAELRLRAAETNLERLDDVLVTLEAQMLSLKKQARQARRYRNLNELIRRAEATVFLLRWSAASVELERAEAALGEAEKEVIGRTEVTARATATRAQAAEGLPQLREAEVEAAAILQRLAIERENHQTEKKRIAQAQLECQNRLDQVAQDLGREQALAADAVEALTLLETEKAEIIAARESEETSMSEAGEKFEEARQACEAGEARLSDVTQKLAAEEARRADFQRRHDELEGRLGRLTENGAELARKISALEDQLPGRELIEEADRKREEAENAQGEARARADGAEEKRLATAEKLNSAHAEALNAANEAARLEAEEQALTRLLDVGSNDLWPPLIDAVSVRPGFEAAFGAALGDDLTAAADEAAPIHWRTLSALDSAPQLPAPARPLSEYVEGPDALNRRLAQVGVVEDEQTAQGLADDLQQGQRLVTRQGALWRWDGYTVRAEAPTAAAQRLEQRNRLAEIADSLAQARHQAQSAQEKLDEARQESDGAVAAERQLREPVREAEAALHQALNNLAQLRQRAAESDSQLSALKENARTVESERQETGKSLDDVNAAQADAPPPEEGRAKAQALQGEVSGLRSALFDAQGAFEGMKRQAETRQARLATIERELTSWNARRTDAIEKQEQLGERRKDFAEERQRLDARPREIDRLIAQLAERLEEAEETRKQAADKLAQAETILAEAEGASRQAEAALAQTREARVRAEAAVAQARQTSEGLAERIAERLESRP